MKSYIIFLAKIHVHDYEVLKQQTQEYLLDWVDGLKREGETRNSLPMKSRYADF